MLEVFKAKMRNLPKVVKPQFIPQMPSDPTSLPMAEIRTRLFQFTELFRWASQVIGSKKAELKITKTSLDNSIRFAQVERGKITLIEAERQIKVKYVKVVNNIAMLEAEILALEGLSVGFSAAKEILSREITVRTSD